MRETLLSSGCRKRNLLTTGKSLVNFNNLARRSTTSVQWSKISKVKDTYTVRLNEQLVTSQLR